MIEEKNTFFLNVLLLDQYQKHILKSCIKQQILIE